MLIGGRACYKLAVGGRGEEVEQLHGHVVLYFVRPALNGRLPRHCFGPSAVVDVTTRICQFDAPSRKQP